MEHNILNIVVEFIAKFGNTFYMYMVIMDMLFYILFILKSNLSIEIISSGGTVI